jgi:hypothetical protein
MVKKLAQGHTASKQQSWDWSCDWRGIPAPHTVCSAALGWWCLPHSNFPSPKEYTQSRNQVSGERLTQTCVLNSTQTVICLWGESIYACIYVYMYVYRCIYVCILCICIHMPYSLFKTDNLLPCPFQIANISWNFPYKLWGSEKAQ